LDEPFAAVDPKTTEDIRRNIRDLAQQGIAILLTDHNVREVLKITDRSYLIKTGQVVTHGTPQQLIHDRVAIDEYLGTTFSDNFFGTPNMQSSTPVPMSQVTPIASHELPPATTSSQDFVSMGNLPRAGSLPSSIPRIANNPPQDNHTPVAGNISMEQLLEREKLFRVLDVLKSNNRDLLAAATAEFLGKGWAGIPVLLDGLERRDSILRDRICLLLAKILGEPVAFDPHAPEEECRHQLGLLRDRLFRKAS
jgi:lipopolysaccharide export system ATP-binding protein